MPDPIIDPTTPQAITGKDALQVHYSGASLLALVATANFVTAKWDRGELTIEVAPEAIVAAMQAAKADGYNFFEDCTAVDWYPAEPRFQLSYSLLSHALRQRIRLVARVSGDTPTIDSITSVYPAANFYEREVFDLFGIHFPGHPRLTRIMMPDNWNGHPLRKDYPVEGYR